MAVYHDYITEQHLRELTQPMQSYTDELLEQWRKETWERIRGIEKELEWTQRQIEEERFYGLSSECSSEQQPSLLERSVNDFSELQAIFSRALEHPLKGWLGS